VSRIRGLRGIAVAAVATTVTTAAAVAGVVAFTGGSAGATGTQPGRSTTVTYTLPVAALASENLCNLDTVLLNGDLKIRTTTTSRSDGSVTVVSTTNGMNLTGYGLPSALDYRGDNDEYSYSYTAPPPGIGTFTVVQYTKLDPIGPAPTMYLVVTLREVVLADLTTVPTLQGTYIACRPPTPSHHKA
jgi:hypothetical protein